MTYLSSFANKICNVLFFRFVECLIQFALKLIHCYRGNAEGSNKYTLMSSTLLRQQCMSLRIYCS